MTEKRARVEWTAADYGEAMLSAVRTHAAKAEERHRDAVVDFNAWWRGGDDLSVRLFMDKACAHDIVERRRIHARDLAGILGLSLPAFMEAYGRASTGEKRTRPASPLPAREAQRPPPAVVAAAWDELCARRTGDDLAARWLAGRGINPAHIRSGFATLDAPAIAALADAPAAGWLRAHAGAAIVAPFRSMRSGDVAALQARAFTPRDKADKRRTVGRLADDDGTPRAYGLAGLTRGARLVLLVEGMLDTLAAEGLTRLAGVAVVGADSAGSLVRCAQWLASVARPSRVVVVRHLDGVDTDGTGQVKADEAVRTLGSRASHFQWAAFARALRPHIDLAPHLDAGLDLADVMRLALDAGVDVRDTFLDAIDPGRGAGVPIEPPAPRVVPAEPDDDGTYPEDAWTSIGEVIDEIWGDT